MLLNKARICMSRSLSKGLSPSKTLRKRTLCVNPILSNVICNNNNNATIALKCTESNWRLRTHSYTTEPQIEPVDSNTFETVCEETLNSLAEYFDDLTASESKLEKADVVYGVGVLTIDLGSYGTYVINRQSPNKQIWLSSPTSGPKRFDYLPMEDRWVYKHDGQSLHGLLKREFEQILGRQLNLAGCLHSK